MILTFRNFLPLGSSISPRNQDQFRWFLILWKRFEVFFHNILFSPISTIDLSSDLINFEENIKNFLFPCGFDPYLPLYPSIRIIFIKLVSLEIFLTRDRVKSTTSQFPLVNYIFILLYLWMSTYYARLPSTHNIHLEKVHRKAQIFIVHRIFTTFSIRYIRKRVSVI